MDIQFTLLSPTPPSFFEDTTEVELNEPDDEEVTDDDTTEMIPRKPLEFGDEPTVPR